MQNYIEYSYNFYVFSLLYALSVYAMVYVITLYWKLRNHFAGKHIRIVSLIKLREDV